jgi:4-hydroxythreonine-4-phosphate dehydrogenase
MRIAVSIGDIAGIGPEVVLRALRKPLEGVEVVVYGDSEALDREVRLLEEGGVEVAGLGDGFEVIESGAASIGAGCFGVIDVTPELETTSVDKGVGDEVAAELQSAAFRRALEAVDDGSADAVVTAPWNKSLFEHLGEPAAGHTDLLDDRYPTCHPVMMLAGPRLRVALATTHVPLSRVPGQITGERIRRVVRTTVGGLRRRFGVDRPSIAVCALNPHAGEGGAMGDEERDVVEPTLEALRGEFEPTAEIEGPLPSDTLFAGYRDGAVPYDAVVCMYHDQGLIPLKLAHFGTAANVTLGLPIIRTSVDHGTAYGIAGEGTADPGSMRYALELAVEMVRRTEEEGG